MKRRQAIKIGSAAFAACAIPAGLFAGCTSPRGSSKWLLYSPEIRDRVIRNSTSSLLSGSFQTWAEGDHTQILRDSEKMIATGDLLRDIATTLRSITREATVQIVQPTAEREASLLSGIDAIIDLPKWDYMLDGGTDVIGVMRASLANTRLIFASEVLGDAMGEVRTALLRSAIADKGCVACFNTISDMNHPDGASGWEFDENHSDQYDIDLSNWPTILGANNLRAIPTMGLGLGAIFLLGHDERAEKWLEVAEESAKTFLGFLSPDGSYFEGLSYIDYAFRTLLSFLDAHQRVIGTIDWTNYMNVEGILDFIISMQAGRTEDGLPDIVNFSDARRSVYPCIPSWLTRNGASDRAQWASNNASDPGYFLDFLWYNEDAPEETPQDELKNARLDLDWIIARSGWDADDAVVAFRSGGPANHEHADRNSFFYKIYGERLLTDHFGAAYDWRMDGWLLRLTEAHNAVLVDGKGHQYHNGEEGTNESQSSATILAYDDEGDRISWTSDATQGYKLVNDDIESVVRTFLFAKPEIVIIRDIARTSKNGSRMSVRYFPDNRDLAIQMSLSKDAFDIQRPNARLHGYVFSDDSQTTIGRLDLSEDIGSFPYANIQTPQSREHEVVTVLVARKTGDERVPEVHLVKVEDGWMFDVDNISGKIETTGDIPVVTWF